MLQKLQQMLDMLRSLKADPRILLLSAAQRNIGKNLCPENNEYGCAISVNEVHRQAFGKPICPSPSTIVMHSALLNDKTFVKVSSAMPGDVIISPTNGSRVGHVGILNTDSTILSNNSLNGHFEAKYTLQTWNSRYKGQLGLEILFFRKIN